jgi:hypothetical protein
MRGVRGCVQELAEHVAWEPVQQGGQERPVAWPEPRPKLPTTDEQVLRELAERAQAGLAGADRFWTGYWESWPRRWSRFSLEGEMDDRLGYGRRWPGLVRLRLSRSFARSAAARFSLGWVKQVAKADPAQGVLAEPVLYGRHDFRAIL